MIVIAEKYGQLGNRLFLFAHVVACALEHGLKVSNPAFDEYADFFESTRRDLFCRYPARPSLLKGGRVRGWLYAAVERLTNSLAYRSPSGRFWEVIHIPEDAYYELSDPKFLAVAKGKQFVFLQGWPFRDEASLHKHAEAVREFFKPVEASARSVEAHVRKAREGCDVLVGVHIRQGDYKQFMGGRYFYETGEYAGLMGGVERLFEGKRVRFLVCSNAVPEAGVFGRLDVTFGPGHLLEDMYSLARCDLIAGPPSTYTLWASSYGKVPLYHVEDPSRGVMRDDFIWPRAGAF